jgi:peroxiredoxin
MAQIELETSAQVVERPAPQSMFTAFWLFQKAEGTGPAVNGVVDGALAAFDKNHDDVGLRGAYVTAGLSAGVDLILWVTASDCDQLQTLAIDLGKAFQGRMVLKHVYLGVASMSQYDPEHGPAFLRGLEPRNYLSVYPFTKTPDWFLLPYETRRDLMIEHGKMGKEFPTILTNTVNSFGIADQEFIVALEDDDPAVLVKMVQRLRAAEVRKYTAIDTPIYLGRRRNVREAMTGALT